MRTFQRLEFGLRPANDARGRGVIICVSFSLCERDEGGEGGWGEAVLFGAEAGVEYVDGDGDGDEEDEDEDEPAPAGHGSLCRDYAVDAYGTDEIMMVGEDRFATIC